MLVNRVRSLPFHLYLSLRGGRGQRVEGKGRKGRNGSKGGGRREGNGSVAEYEWRVRNGRREGEKEGAGEPYNDGLQVLFPAQRREQRG